MDNSEFKDTNFEAMSTGDAKKLIESLPDYTATEDISDLSTHKLEDMDLGAFSTETSENSPAQLALPVLRGDESLSADEKFDKDLDDARHALDDILAMKEEVIRELLAVAKTSSAPRAFEVLSETLEKFAAIAEKKIDLQLKAEKVREIKVKSSQEVAKKSSNTIDPGDGKETKVIVMSTSDLLTLMKEQAEIESSDVIEGEVKEVK